MLNWWTASLLSNACIIFVEYANRNAAGGWTTALPYTVIPIIMAQYCLFLTFNGAPHWLAAWMVFTVGNSIMRVAAISTWAPGEVTDWRLVVAGVVGMITFALVTKEGLK